MVDATWSGDRPMNPKCVSAHVTSASRRATRSSWLRGSSHMRLTRSPVSGDANVNRSRFSGARWKS